MRPASHALDNSDEARRPIRGGDGGGRIDVSDFFRLVTMLLQIGSATVSTFFGIDEVDS